MEKNKLEKYIEQQFKYLNKYFTQAEIQKKDSEDKIKDLQIDLKVTIVSLMIRYGYGVGSSEFCNIVREVIDELDD